jgi:hypothetical protein
MLADDRSVKIRVRTVPWRITSTACSDGPLTNLPRDRLLFWEQRTLTGRALTKSSWRRPGTSTAPIQTQRRMLT